MPRLGPRLPNALKHVVPTDPKHMRFVDQLETPPGRANAPIKLQGKIVKLEWVNPHSWIHLDVTTPSGGVSWRRASGALWCLFP